MVLQTQVSLTNILTLFSLADVIVTYDFEKMEAKEEIPYFSFCQIYSTLLNNYTFVNPFPHMNAF